VPAPRIPSLGLSKGLAGCTQAVGEEGGGRKGEIRVICKPTAACGNEESLISSQCHRMEMKKQLLGEH